MSLRILSGIFGTVKPQCSRLQNCISGIFHQKRFRKLNEPKLRYPYWYVKKENELQDQQLTPANQNFISDVVFTKYLDKSTPLGSQSPLKTEPVPKGEWFPGCQRTGLIGIKLGLLPLWTRDGNVIRCTLIKIQENQVINYIHPGQKDLRKYSLRYKEKTKHMGNLVVGAVDCDPTLYTKGYCGLFNTAGTMPKKILTKFAIHPDAVIQPGTTLYAAHFQVGDYVDVTGKTIYRGFQGVMKRWGFHGMPASHGQTKTHRRPGCIGGPGSKVWRGKKMPGHVGNRTRTVRGLKILRINHKHGVLYVRGCVPGHVNSFVYVHDTISTPKVRETAPRFPTFYPENLKEPLPDEEYDESVFQFTEPTIKFEVEKVSKTRK